MLCRPRKGAAVSCLAVASRGAGVVFATPKGRLQRGGSLPPRGEFALTPKACVK
jgi:hypothetical protein